MVLLASTALASSGQIVRADGRIGTFTVDVTTEAQVRAQLGAPAKVRKEECAAKSTCGHTLEYLCGTRCFTDYSFNDATGRLSDFLTRSPDFRTVHGSHAGMSAAAAASREHKRIDPACGFDHEIRLRSDRTHLFVLAVSGKTVYAIAYLGPHSVYYDGLC